MFGSELLEVALGLIFLFFILSVLLSSAREVLEGYLQTRAIHLERGIRELLKDKSGKGLAQQIYDHPMISSLFRGDYDPGKLTRRWLKRKDDWLRAPFRNNLPAYIPARNFALALLDLSGRGVPAANVADRPLTLDGVAERVSVRIADPAVRRAVTLAIDNARGDLEQARVNLEAWFDSGMDRVSGWYRKETQWILLVMGLLTAFTLNIDSLRVARALYHDDALRSVIVADAEAFAHASAKEGVDVNNQTALLAALGCRPNAAAGAPAGAAAGAAAVAPVAAAAVAPVAAAAVAPTAAPAVAASNAQADVSCAERRIRKLKLPIGWEDKKFLPPWGFKGSWGQWWEAWTFPWSSIPGWLVTALAVSMGAPFWFDLLNKVMVIRSTVKPREKSPEEGSEDRQPRRRTAPAPESPPPAPAPAPAAHSPAHRAAPDRPPDHPNRHEADDAGPEANN